jgi:hypothetical protein
LSSVGSLGKRQKGTWTPVAYNVALRLSPEILYAVCIWGPVRPYRRGSEGFVKQLCEH